MLAREARLVAGHVLPGGAGGRVTVRSVLFRVAAIVVVGAGLVWAPLPGIPGACVSLKNALLVLAAVLIVGKTLYDTFYGPRVRP